jgi:CRP-like cAMP-binding protein
MMGALGRPVSASKGTTLFREGEEPRGVYALLSGKARMTISGVNGTFGVSFLAGGGSILGLPAVFAAEPYSMTAELVQDSELVVVSSGLLLEHTSTHADFALRVLRLLGEEVRAARRVQVGTPSLRRRLRHVEAKEIVGRTQENEQQQKETIN